MNRFKEIPQRHTRVIRVLFLILAGLICTFTYFFIAKEAPLRDRENEKIPPREMPLVTIEMNYDTLQYALTHNAKEWCEIKEPGLLSSDMVLKPTNEKSFDDIVIPKIAKETASAYPKLFGYDSTSHSFTMKEAQKGKYVVTPAWLVENLIQKGALVLPSR